MGLAEPPLLLRHEFLDLDSHCAHSEAERSFVGFLLELD